MLKISIILSAYTLSFVIGQPAVWQANISRLVIVIPFAPRKTSLVLRSNARLEIITRASGLRSHLWKPFRIEETGGKLTNSNYHQAQNNALFLRATLLEANDGRFCYTRRFATLQTPLGNEWQADRAMTGSILVSLVLINSSLIKQ